MEQRVSIERMEEAINLFGSFDENIRLLEAEFHVTVVNRDGELRISGEPEEVMMAAKAVEALLTLSGKGESITEQHVRLRHRPVPQRPVRAYRRADAGRDLHHLQRPGPSSPRPSARSSMCRRCSTVPSPSGWGPPGTRQDVSGGGGRPWPPSGPSRSTASS